MIDLSGQEYDQKEQVRTLIKKEDAIFPEDNISSVLFHQMETHLNEKTPVQQNFNSIPRTLYDELKNYIEDLLRKKSFIKPQSSYSPPVVIVRKKDGSIWFSWNYCRLNSRAISDHHTTHDPGSKISVFWIRAELTSNFTLTYPVDNTQHSSPYGAFKNDSEFHLI